MKRVQVLLSLSTSLRAAFPDRADALLEEIERWFPLEARLPIEPGCALCGAGRAPHARCFVGAPPASRFCVYGSRPHPSDGPSFALCSACIDRVLDAEGSLLRILADAVRALRSPDPEANEPAVRRLEEIHARWIPATRAAPCAICAGSGLAVAPSVTVVCSACVATAHHVLHSTSPHEWSRLARELDEADDIDGAMAAWDHLRALGEPSVEATDAVARRMSVALGRIIGPDAPFENGPVEDSLTDVHAPRAADDVLTRYHPSETARRLLLATVIRLAEKLDSGMRFYRQEGQTYEEITEEFEILARFAIPRSQALWTASASGVVAIYGGPLTCEQAARRISCWGGRPEIMAVGTRGGAVRLHLVPEGATVWIGDWTSLVPEDQVRLLARSGTWRVFAGAPDREELTRIAPELRRLVVDELRLLD